MNRQPKRENVSDVLRLAIVEARRLRDWERVKDLEQELESLNYPTVPATLLAKARG